MRQRRLYSVLTASVVGLVLAMGFMLRYEPRFQPGVYTLQGQAKETTFMHPLWLMKPAASRAEFQMTMTLGQWHPSTYVLKSTGIESLTVNGIPVEAKKTTDLSAVLKEGDNLITGNVFGPEKPYPYITFMMTPSMRDIDTLFLALCLSILSAFLAFAVAMKFLAPTKHLWLPSVAAFGTALRTFYVIGTPYWNYSYDWEGHQEYVLLMLKSPGIPPANLGWETYQPPLAYLLDAAWLKGAMFFGAGYGSLQVVSLLLSIATLFIGLMMTQLLWKRENEMSAFFFGLILATFPGLVYVSSQVSNDVTWVFSAFLFTAFLLRWFQSGALREWVLASLLLGISLLVKSNALLLLPILGFALLLRPGLPKHTKIWLGIVSMILIVITAGWLFVYRFGIEGESSIVGNIDQEQEVLAVPQGIRYMLTFNPVQILAHPFIDDLSDPRRMYFPEYLFKSSLFGHHTGSGLALSGMLLLSAMGMTLMSVLSFIRTRRSELSLLLGSMAATLVVGVFLYRLIYPFDANQHFRFIVPLIIPLAYFAANMVRRTSKTTTVVVSLLVTFTALSTAVIVKLSM